MKRKGFTLIELIIGIFLLGLVSTVGFPIIQNSIGNYNRIEERQHMYYLCEMVVERLRAKDINLEPLFIELETNKEITISSIGLTDFGKYKCLITKTKETLTYWNLDVKIYIDNEMRNSQYVEYRAVVKR